MKKSVFILTAALSFGVAAAQPAPVTPVVAQVPTLTDVPAGHWAKDAIDRLVANGVLLGYPDGTFRGTQNLTRYEAAVIIARLLNQIGNGQTAGLDPETLTSLQNAVQELSADLAALGVRVNDLEQNAVSKEDFTRLEERVEALNGNTDLAGVAGRFDELSANYETLRADVDDSANSIAALNDLTVLLNQDILDLQDRASALEAAQADFVTRTDFNALSSSVKSIDGRVATLENAPKFTIGGSIEATYGSIGLTSGSQNFDIDRLTTGMPVGDYFSSDSFCKVTLTSGSTVLFTTVRDYNTKYRCADTTGSFTGIKAQLTFGVSNIKTANGAIIINSASATLRMLNGPSPAVSATTDATGKVTGTNSETFLTVERAQASGSTASGVKFAIRYDGGFSNSGNSSNSNFKFNDYLVANDNDSANVLYRRGIIATVDASSTLPVLAPKFTVVAGSAAPRVFSKEGASWVYPLAPINMKDAAGVSYLSPVSPFAGGYFGVRLATQPAGFGTLALNYVQGNVGTPLRRDALGADASFKVGPVSVDGVFVASKLASKGGFNLDDADKAGYAKFGVDISGVKITANYHYVDPNYESGVAGMSANDADFYVGSGGYKSSMPFGPNENGYGVTANFSVGPVAVGGYLNSFVAITPNNKPDISAYVGDARQTAYGVQAGTSTISGFSLKGYYNNATVGDVRVTELFGNNTYWNNFDGYDGIDDFNYGNSSNFGVTLKHDGKAADALVKGLDINLNYTKFYDDNQNVKEYGFTDIVAAAKYDGNFGLVKLTPFVRFHSFQNANAGRAVSDAHGDYRDGSLSNYEGSNEVSSYSSVKFGIQLATNPLDVVTKPSLFAGVSDRQNISNSTSELFANGGITFNEFIVPEAKLSVGYSYYKGNGISDSGVVGRRNAAYSITSDSVFANPSNGTPWTSSRSTGDAELDGYYAQLEAYGLRAAYGVFNYKNLNDSSKNSTAQAFKVSTKINF